MVYRWSPRMRCQTANPRQESRLRFLYYTITIVCVCVISSFNWGWLQAVLAKLHQCNPELPLTIGIKQFHLSKSVRSQVYEMKLFPTSIPEIHQDP